jgi:NAD(P)-dependent dehydrogenase (short-subunit alcohol dehydrogenase family)
MQAMNKDRQRVAVITGASSGIGREAARALAAQGWRVIGTGRDAARMAQVEAQIGSRQFTMLEADLSLVAGAQRLASEVARLTDRVDVLINNSGGISDALRMTPEGLEHNFASNHLVPFVLTRCLMPLLEAAAADAPHGSVRILMTASDTSEMIPGINLDDMQNLGNWDAGLAYCTGKLANVLFAKALSVRLEGSGMVAHAYAPGAVASNFFTYATEQTRENVRDLAMATPEQGADTLVWLATSEESGQCSGLYWEKRAIKKPNPVVNDAAVVERFWAESEKLVASVAA